MTTEWINIKGHLPKKDEQVLFYVSSREEIFAGRYETLFGKDVFVENMEGWWFEDEIITHWMPLPNPPKE